MGRRSHDSSIELLPASEEIQKREQYFALLGRDESDLAASFTGYFFPNLQKGVAFWRNSVVFRPPLNPLPILNKAGPFALGADLSQILDFNHRMVLILVLSVKQRIPPVFRYRAACIGTDSAEATAGRVIYGCEKV
jgi:hypothetical protein